ncbi:hypothetical protein LSH36_236g00042 [Paralvinella palmiformis]|uniref:Pre-mRNA-processing factor 19 n=1 Tax=Paralvinella palmiformis TaxID=53620 RepID=A0AAD9N3A4_9ANNE|nr:hypothetical protein LSH36_236g00042 [Paralvinella palmiformis]
MSLACAISSEVPEHPVISPVSGCIYERRLIEKYISENGTDPMNGEKLTVDMLVDVKTTPLVKPRPPSATSIPAILKSLQDEWHDAACRVIARLTKEVTAAREALATLKPQAGITAAPGAMPIAQPAYGADAGIERAEEPMEEAGMTDDILQKLQDKATLLTAERKKRGKTVPEGLANSDDIRSYRQLASHVGLHSASMPGMLALDICLKDTSKFVTGGNDRNAVVFNKDTEQVMAILQGHTKKVTGVIYHPEEELVITASQDQTIRVWGVQQTAPCAHVIRAHEGPVTGISLHATGDYLLSCSIDSNWAFSDIRVGRVLTKVSDSQQALTCAQFHPDGLIFGTGTEDAVIKIWDLKERTNVANFPGHSGPVTSIAFSENGYYLATAADDSVVKLWDLRKLKNFKSITLDDRYEVKSLCFDQSGTYLAVAGTDVRVYLCKQWQELKVFNDHTALATGVRFGHNASFIASASMDRSLKIFGL